MKELEYEFPTVNRSLIVVSYRQAYVDWTNSLSDREPEEIKHPHTLESLNEDSPAYLFPDISGYDEIDLYLDKIWFMLFNELLAGWTGDQELWPQKRSRKMFDKWFQVTVHSMVRDAWGKDPLDYHDY